jgi:DNA gyrase subunit B
VGETFVASGEYRALQAAWAEVAGVTFPVVVDDALRAGAAAPEETVETAAAADDAAGADGAPAEDDAPAPQAGDTTFDTLDALVDFFIAAGRKGVSVNRYKGLGEMNPDTLWSTTMDPEHRTLLEVHAEDHAEADLMFTTLMGDQVEPRRKFIEDHALEVTNLDV